MKKNMSKTNKVFNVFFSKTFLLYFIFGGMATIVDWGSFWILVYLLNTNYLFAVTLSFIFGSITNFSLNKTLNFRNKYRRWDIQFMLYLLVAITGLILTLALMWLLVEWLSIDKMTSRIIVSAIVLGYNFLGHKYFTFKILN